MPVDQTLLELKQLQNLRNIFRHDQSNVVKMKKLTVRAVYWCNPNIIKSKCSFPLTVEELLYVANWQCEWALVKESCFPVKVTKV